MRAKRRDANERAIVEALQKAGAKIVRLHEPLDLLVCYQGNTWLLEIKTEHGRLKKSQREFLQSWNCRAAVVRTPEQALQAIGALKE